MTEPRHDLTRGGARRGRPVRSGLSPEPASRDEIDTLVAYAHQWLEELGELRDRVAELERSKLVLRAEIQLLNDELYDAQQRGKPNGGMRLAMRGDLNVWSYL